MAHIIKTLLQSVMKTENSWKIDLLQSWPDIIGSLNTKVNVERIQDSTLVLSVSNACLLQELYLLSPILLKKINEKLDQPRIKRLRFKQAGIKKIKRKRAPVQKKKRPITVVLSAKERNALKNIEDQELGEALKRFLIRCYQEKE